MRVGDKTEQRFLRTSAGEDIDLVDDERCTVLFFYPKDDTRICSKEACLFRDHYRDFRDAGARVIGVSADDAASHNHFRDKYGLPFCLVSDEDRSLRRIFAVKNTMGFLPGRVTFVIDSAGVIRHRFSSATNARAHMAEALAVVRSLRARRA